MHHTRLLRALASTLERGAPLTQELEVLGEPGLAALLAEGVALPEALSRVGALRSPDEIAQVEAGLKAGRLPLILRCLADRIDLARRVRQELRRILAPVILAGLVFVVAFVGVIFAARLFKPIFNDIGIVLPAPTRMLMTLAEPDLSIVLPIAAAMIMGTMLLWIPLTASRLEYWIPVWGRIARSRDLSAYCTSMGLLLEAQIPLSPAAQMAAATAKNGWFRDEMMRVHEAAQQGEGASAAYAGTGNLPHFVQWSIQMGDRRGDLPAIFRSLGELYARDIEGGASALTQLVPVASFFLLLLLLSGSLFVLFMPLATIVSVLL